MSKILEIYIRTWKKLFGESKKFTIARLLCNKRFVLEMRFWESKKIPNAK